MIANEFGQYRLEVSLALTQEEGDQMLSELVGRERVESPEVFWEGSTDIGPCQELLQNSLFSPNFFLPLMTYELYSYSGCLYCANFHTPLPLLS